MFVCPTYPPPGTHHPNPDIVKSPVHSSQGRAFVVTATAVSIYYAQSSQVSFFVGGENQAINQSIRPGQNQSQNKSKNCLCNTTFYLSGLIFTFFCLFVD